MRRHPHTARAVLAGLLLWQATATRPGTAAQEPRADLGRLIASMSEPGGYFDTDNLVSNEASYAHVVARLAPVGGVYIGVGPEQNFNYIARTRPTRAFLVDLRRDNMIHVLLLIGVLAEAETPADYLATLFSRDVHLDPTADLETIAAATAAAIPQEPDLARNLTRIRETLETDLGVELSADDWKRMALFYRTYFEIGLGLSFMSHGHSGWGRYPSYRELLLARTPGGEPAHFLAAADDYRFVRDLARSGRLVPIVGDFAGDGALRAIGDFLRERDEEVTTFYTSNVEFYLARTGRFAPWVENVRRLPLADDAIFLRAYFDYGRRHPQSVPGFRSTIVRQLIPTFLELWDAGELRSYWDVCAREALP
ncbi:MAG: hypothetical protein R3190_11295 [Thermoanaerobaculia bacterium]|nr:hypothetical protein [Thermoanaerobaculia bacterium]